MTVPPLSPVAPLPSMPGKGPSWFSIAEYQMRIWDAGMKDATAAQRVDFETQVDWDEAYFAAVPQFGGSVHNIGDCRPARNTDWCSAFVNYCLHRAGYNHTGNGYARSFLDRNKWFFHAIPEPRVGCVVVVGLGGRHVGLLASSEGLPSNPRGNVGAPPGGFKLLGGNQGGRVCVKDETRALMATDDSLGNRSPYLWPLRMGCNCNVGIATAAPHSCGVRHPG